MLRILCQRMNGALGFLTVLPAGKQEAQSLGRSVGLFPVVGFILGILLWAQWALLAARINVSWNALGLVLAGALWTKALHLDGLADSMDALLSHRSPERMLEIMKDSRIGTMGALALFFDVALRWQILSGIPAGAMPAALILPPVLGRMAMGLGMAVFTYARQNGLASAFVQGLRKSDAALLLLSGAAVSLLMMKAAGILLFSLAILATLIALQWCQKRLGGYTGDVLGALNEVIEIMTLTILGIMA